ncbi:hypothetical protein DPMN_168703 [Dreissena polymorpha]|uniref:Uncharacterized protein n=1 Tax=Dreissena polymorpha TaxID=45954 RepID=A0A9D4F362_DREPO|nr:hypothetical protein DPMN_168703 [Dreissena polymorpha]
MNGRCNVVKISSAGKLVPRRYNSGEYGGGGAGYVGGGGGYGTWGGHKSTSYDYTDAAGLQNNSSTHSLNSAKSSRARKASTCGLIILLILGALLLAFGIGLLVYYLLHASADAARYHTSTAPTDVTLHNVPYHHNMANMSSKEFLNVANPFCEQTNQGTHCVRMCRHL